MKMLTKAEADEWCKAREIALDERGRPGVRGGEFHKERFMLPSAASKHLWLSRAIEDAIQPWRTCLLWVRDWGIWTSSENWHLYYRLRQSYGDRQLMEDAPAHLFLDFESNDLVTFIQVGISMGFDLSVLSADDYGHAFISHDEWFDLVLQDKTSLDQISAKFDKAGIRKAQQQ